MLGVLRVFGVLGAFGILGRLRLFGYSEDWGTLCTQDTKNIRGTRKTLQSLVILDAVFILHACVASGRQRLSRNYTGEK